jgi:ankyrin repeat protein
MTVFNFFDFVAAKNGNKEIVENLIKNKAKINLKDFNGYSALILGNFR